MNSGEMSRDVQIDEIWLNFVEGKVERNPGIREVIYQSWLRSKQLDIDPYLEKAPQVLQDSALSEEISRKNSLLAVADSIVEDLFSAISGSNFGIFIVNERGIVLKGYADSDNMALLKAHGLFPGHSWAEETMGTNSIGMCIRLKCPIQVTWAEHFCKLGHITVCIAAPILDSDGELIGVLTMTGFRENANPHTMGLVISGAKIIEREMRLRSAYEDIKLSHQYVLEMTESLPSGILVVNPQGIVTSINNIACELLKSEKKDFLNQDYTKNLGKLDCIEKTLKYGQAQEETEHHFERGNYKLHFTMSSRPIINSQSMLDGAVIILRKIEDVIRITNKMAGYKARFTFEDIIGETPNFNSVINQARSAADVSSNVLILGESGTGKEMIAQAIHNNSSRRNGPFVAINCGAVPRELIGSELFGYEEGAFTGAKRGGSPGKFELANHGTIFLDEIGDMPLDLQLVLLRVLQDRIVVRIGGYQSINVKVRLIAATNKDLKRQVELGLFREDLYYRINVITLNLPPLRARRGDIMLLADHFLRKKADKSGKQIASISPEAIDLLSKYRWPGNVRELENIIERALVFSNGQEIEAELLHLPLCEVKTYGSESSLKSEEKEIIRNTLMKNQGNISKTAKILGITRATLYRKMRHHDLS